MIRVTVALALLALVAGVRDADACTCATRSLCYVYAGSDAVFLGTVLDVRERAQAPKVVRMRVARAYKGVRGGTVVTVTLPGGNSANCSLDVEKGQRWVIYGERTGGSYGSSLCSGSYMVQAGDPSPDLPPVPGSVTGVLGRDDDAGEPKGVGGVTVRVDAPTGPISARTRADGRFRLAGVPVGRRTIIFDVGRGEAAEADIELESSADCVDVQVSVGPGGGVVGTVLDAAGAPLADAWVRLLGRSAGVMDRTKENGEFRLVGLEPGSYVVSVGIGETPSGAFPYRPQFYPAAETAAAAEAIEVEASIVRLPPMVMRSPVPRTTIAAEIVCRDGTRAIRGVVVASAGVSTRSDRSGTQAVDGRFTVQVIPGPKFHGRRRRRAAAAPGGRFYRDDLEVDEHRLRGHGGAAAVGPARRRP